MPDRIVLDHVAHAAERHELLLPRYAGELGGRYVGHGEGTGFSPLQVRFANDAKLELLRPHQEDRYPFLRTFLDRRGPGLHHATFKVDDIRATIADLEAAGYLLADVDLSSPEWMEAFIHPRSAHGFLVQLAQSDGGPPAQEPAAFPAAVQEATLERLVLAVASLDAALLLYRDRLGGLEVDTGAGWVDLDHGARPLVRLWQPEDPAVLGGLPGRAHHLELGVPDPAAVTGASEAGPDRWEVPAAANHGTALVLHCHA